MEPASVVLGRDAASLRRQLRPSAWCALEALVARGRLTADGMVAAASVRTIADDLGVATNTAHRALKTLRAVGLVEHAQSRGRAGRFDVTSYRLLVRGDVLARVPSARQSTLPRPARQQAPSARARAAVAVGQQLVLLPSE